MKATILLLTLLILSGCETWDADPVDPRLPEYTQRGENVAACILNDQAWVANCTYTVFFGDYCPGVQVVYDTISNYSVITFKGRDGPDLNFRIDDLIIRSNQDLVKLEGTSLVFPGGDNNSVFVGNIPGSTECNGDGPGDQYGELHIRRAEATLPDTGGMGIFSGTFGFDYKSDCSEYHGYKGRFDFKMMYIDYYHAWN